MALSILKEAVIDTTRVRFAIRKSIGSDVRTAAVACLMSILIGCSSPPPPGNEIKPVWPLPPDQPRIRYVTSLTGSKDFKVTSGNKLVNLLIGKKGNQSLLKPYAVATDKTRVYVSDTGLKALWVFDKLKQQVTLFGHDGETRLELPTGVCPGDSGQVFVADSKLARVFLFDSNGKMVRAFGKTGELTSPVGVAFDSTSQRLFVVDSKKHQVIVFNAQSGQLMSEIGMRGDSAGLFNFPTNIFIRFGKLYITDTGNFRIQVLDLDGRVLSAFGRAGDGIGDFARPKGVGVDSEGHIYVADAGFDNFQIFDSVGSILMFVGSAGQGAGQFWLPAGVWVDPSDQIYVVDSYNQRVQVFQYLTDSTVVTN